jgi:hypothetical protein
LGGTLGSGERIITTKVFADTSAPLPEDWDLHLVDTSYGVANGLAIPGLTTDFGGMPISSTPSIGLYEKYSIVNIPNCTFIYGDWSACSTSGWQNRSYTSSPAGCTGTPPMDSLQRTCDNGIRISSFYYSSSNKRIYIKCNVAGVMIITNVTGNIVRTVNYNANGYFIDVSTLPPGTYIAATYGRSLTFRK